jgi:protein subunit release factor B
MFPFPEELARLGLDPSDFTESFARSSGPGGQHVNKVSTAVTLRHGPSGLAVTVQDTRSQSANRELARERLLAAIVAARRREREERIQAREKRRRQSAPRPRAVKRRILEGKRRHAEVKARRRAPVLDATR